MAHYLLILQFYYGPKKCEEECEQLRRTVVNLFEKLKLIRKAVSNKYFRFSGSIDTRKYQFRTLFLSQSHENLAQRVFISLHVTSIFINFVSQYKQPHLDILFRNMQMSTSKKVTTLTAMNRNMRKDNQDPKKTVDRAMSPMRKKTLGEAEGNSHDAILSGALGIVTSPIPAPSATRSRRGSLASRGSSVGRRRGSSVSQKRGSMLSERRSSELQLDNADRLSGLMLSCIKQAMDELDCDYESDFDE